MTKKPRNFFSSLDESNDWQTLFDFDDKRIVFPPSIYATNERPDIVIWSKKLKRVILIELSCCAEEGIAAAQARKEARYKELVEEIRRIGIWSPTLFTIEVGARGLVASSTYRAFVSIGLTQQQANSLCRNLSVTAARCSYAIYLAHTKKMWEKTDLVSTHS